MFGPRISLASVSAPTGRSFFGNGSFQPSPFRQMAAFRPSIAGALRLGQTPQEWYQRAKAALAKFDALLARTAKIANKTERDAILAWVGTSATEGTPAYRYATVKSDLQTDVEAFTPPAVNAYQLERRQNRITKLEDFNTEFETKVTNAENVYGKLPDPVVIERERIVSTAAAPPETPPTDWTLPVIVGGGAVAVAVLVSLLAGGGK